MNVPIRVGFVLIQGIVWNAMGNSLSITINVSVNALDSMSFTNQMVRLAIIRVSLVKKLVLMGFTPKFIPKRFKKTYFYAKNVKVLA